MRAITHINSELKDKFSRIVPSTGMIEKLIPLIEHEYYKVTMC